jgi:acyl-CoA synthetase (AMP-forming)/AMP-acid ligase II
VTTIHFVPSMLQAFLGHDGVRTCTGLRRIVCSGEALPAELQNRTLQALPQATLLNLYGPTEAAIEVTWWDCRVDGSSTVPIGRPIGNVSVHVLDGQFGEVPRGVAGELCLGGEGLARGYWGRAGLTAQAFVADPSDANGGRLYRTGDLVRWRADGQIEYLGRIDHQVKVRGFRIELGEVEAQLQQQGGVGEAVVVAQAGAGGGVRLVAYVSARAGEVLDGAALRESLGRELPDYMVPSVIVVLERLPLNANGKVDRKALPAAEWVSGRAHEAPQGEVEEALARIWAEVLGLERVGRHDNFFEVGGHSLMAIRVVARLQGELRADVGVRDVFQHPTLAGMAARLGGDRQQAVGQALSEIDAFIDSLESA